MNTYEARAWRRLVELGAREIIIGGKSGLDLSTCRPKAKQIADFIDSIIQVSGNSRTVRRHQDRQGRLVFIITDTNLPLPKQNNS